jgi:predicted metal-dependent hydrolase
MDARLREGIRLFNERQFFASHEALESFYRETEAKNKAFLEGLIQLAVAFRIFSEFGEVKGPVRMIYQSLIRFENFSPAYLQIRVKELCQSVESWAKAAEASDKTPTPSDIPKIQLQRFSPFP